MKVLTCFALAFVASGCVASTNNLNLVGNRECTAPFDDYSRIGADLAANAAARRQASLDCGLALSGSRQARDRYLENTRNTPEEQARIDRGLARMIRGQQ